VVLEVKEVWNGPLQAGDVYGRAGTGARRRLSNGK
jgi:hypothetical protein